MVWGPRARRARRATAIDIERFVPRGNGKFCDRANFVVGWTGIGPNLPYLQAIEVPIAHFMEIFDDARLLVVADRDRDSVISPVEGHLRPVVPRGRSRSRPGDGRWHDVAPR
jgi:hypothetical protein